MNDEGQYLSRKHLQQIDHKSNFLIDFFVFILDSDAEPI